MPKKLIGKRWGEDIPNIIRVLDQLIRRQRYITGYRGPSQGFHRHVADHAWDRATYDEILYNSDVIRDLLYESRNRHLVPPGLANQARMLIYEGGY